MSQPTRSKAPLIAFLVLVLIAMSTTLFLLEKNKRAKNLLNQGNPPDLTLNPDAASNKSAMEQAEENLSITGAQPVFPNGSDPLALMNSIGNAVAKKDLPTLDKLMAQAAVSAEAAERLKKLINLNSLALKPQQPVREVGEIELNKKRRYALELAERPPGQDRIYFDLIKKDGRWFVEKVTFPSDALDPAASSPDANQALFPDALALADEFLMAVLRQDFATAKKFVNPKNVSDATLAGLCILFEEGNYRLRPQKPLRAIIQKPLVASFLAHVEAADGTQAAQFAVILKKTSADQSWNIDELNLDQLLSDYAQRIAGGDVYYSPLIKNPAGGDTLVLYFEFDEGRLTPRTERQLMIVANILKTDPNKKIRLSGHTDAKGSAEYNQDLSAQRAIAVKEFLIRSSVSPQQITTTAKGLTEPRRPNLKETGEDNPDGRRVNRRTEIYLDF
jgi:outer membrane protein OmpA-like peptidoglycan-associated protein